MSKTQTQPKRYSPGWLDNLDKRTALAQMLEARHTELANDLGGIDHLSYQQKVLIDRALFIELHLQNLEAELANGGEFNATGWVNACNSLQGLLSKLGLKRQAKTVPALQSYISKGADK